MNRKRLLKRRRVLMNQIRIFKKKIVSSKSEANEQLLLNKLEQIRKSLAKVEDGLFGNNTLNTLRVYLAGDKDSYLIKIMNILQGMHYIEYMTKSPTQERFARGWLGRVNITK